MQIKTEFQGWHKFAITMEQTGCKCWDPHYIQGVSEMLIAPSSGLFHNNTTLKLHRKDEMSHIWGVIDKVMAWNRAA